MSEKTIEEIVDETFVKELEWARQEMYDHEITADDLGLLDNYLDLARCAVKKAIKSKVEEVLKDLWMAIPLPETPERWAYAKALGDARKELGLEE